MMCMQNRVFFLFYYMGTLLHYGYLYIRHVIQQHKYKITLGLPIVALLASTLSFAGPGESLLFKPHERFLALGATTTVQVVVKTQEPINVVSGTVLVPSEITVTNVTTDDTIIDLWTQEPELQPGTSIIEFAGGIISTTGFTGKGNIFSFDVQAKEKGHAELLFENATVLAHDGKGTETLDKTKSISFIIRPKQLPSPDINKDNDVSVGDLASMLRKLWGAYDPMYDLNNDGEVSIADVLILIKSLRS